MNNLTGKSQHSSCCSLISADAILSWLVGDESCRGVGHRSSRLVSQEVSNLLRVKTPKPGNISDNFSKREFTAAFQYLKTGKATGPDSIWLELIIHDEAALKFWLRNFLSFCLRRLKITKIWRRALVVAIPQQMKPVGNPKSYQPIFLLCVLYKNFERLIYARVKPIIDPLLPKDQAGFQH